MAADDFKALQRQVNSFQKKLDDATKRDTTALRVATNKIKSQVAEIAALRLQLKDAEQSIVPDQPLLCDERQARQIIPISSSTFKKLVADGRLHVIRLNPPHGRKYYKLAELLALAEPDPADRRDKTVARSRRPKTPHKPPQSAFTDS